MLKKFDKDRIVSMVILTISIIFYLTFGILDGVFISGDSDGYIQMAMLREPVYPLFLATVRFFFGFMGEGYLFVAVILQSLLMAVATFSLVNYLRMQLKLSMFISGVLFSILLATSLLCRFAAGRGVMYQNGIESESLCIPLFLFFIRYLFDYVLEQKNGKLFILCGLTFLMISVRKQMFLALFLLILAMVYIAWKNRKGFLKIAICVLIIFACTKLFDFGYNYVLRGTLSTHTQDNRFLATMVFYTSKEEDANYIEDEKLRNLFIQIYQKCDENKYLKGYAGKGWNHRVEHFGQNYDRIQIDTMGPIIRDFVDANYTGDTIYLQKKVDEVTHEVINVLLPKTLPQIIATFVDNVFSGLMTTVAKRMPIFIGYTIFIYLAYIILLVMNIKKNGLSKSSIFAIITMLSLILNIGIVSAVIFCQTRYTIYNMPLFYMSGVLLIKEFWDSRFIKA